MFAFMKIKENTKNTLSGHGDKEHIKDSLSDKETLDLLMLIRWTSDIMHKVRQKELAPFGLNRFQAAVLQVVYDHGGKAKSNEIARQILRERHSAHELLRRMEKQGLIKGIDDVRRKNGVSFELTAKGLAAYRQVVKRRIEHKIFSSLSKKQRDQLTISLRTLYSAASEILQKNMPSFLPMKFSDD